MVDQISQLILDGLRALARPDKIAVYAGFFKSGPGEYGEGDRFLGVTVPDQKKLATQFVQKARLADLQCLLDSEFHECRAVALQILVTRFAKTKVAEEQAPLVALYEANFARVNNWDLVDMSAPKLTGPWYASRDRAALFFWARSPDLWTRRIAIMSTFAFIREGDFATSLELADILLLDRQDLIQKATGWMLREIGNRAGQVERNWLAAFPSAMDTGPGTRTDLPRYQQMGRTMLRYAIEKFPKPEYQEWLNGTIPGHP